MAEQITAVAILKDEMSAGFKKIQDSLDKTSKKGKKATKEIDTSFRGLYDSMGLVRAGFVGLAGVGIVSFGKALANASAEMETLTTKFSVLLGDMDSAKARMQELSKFAQTTPFQLTEIANASRVLQTLGGTALATGESLRMVGDASAISGESFENLAIHVGRAFSGLQANRPIGESLARLQELGLVSGTVRNQIEDLTKQAKGAEAWKILQTELKKTEGGMDKLSKTFTGLVSTLKDQFQAVLRQIGEGGGFDTLKDGLQETVNIMNEMIDGGIFQRIGAGVGIVVSSIKFLFNTLQLQFVGVQLVWEKMLHFLVTSAEKAVSKLEDVFGIDLVPDSVRQGLNQMRQDGEIAMNALKVTIEEDAEDAGDALFDMVQGFNKLVDGVDNKKFKEKVQGASKAVQEASEAEQKALKELQAMRAFQGDYELEQERERQEEKLSIMRSYQGDYEKILADKVSAEADAQKESDSIKRKEMELMSKQFMLAQTITSSLSTIAQNALGKDKKNAKARQKIALGEAFVNTSLGVTKALSTGNFFEAGMIFAQGGAQISTIATQKFNQGGVVKSESGKSNLGDQTLVRANAGEIIFTPEQLKAMGNMGAVTVAPTITITGNADSNTVRGLEDTLQSFADKIIDAERGGYLNFENDFNLVGV